MRLALLDRFRFLEDEALYSFWALHFWRQDPLLLTVQLDKPPLYIWLLSLCFQLFGASEAGARWLNIALSTCAIPVVGATARSLKGAGAGLLAAAALTLNPLAISYGPTAFTDPLLVLSGSLALYAALKRRPFWAGLWLGAAIVTKQQGLFYAPLVAATLVASRAHGRARPPKGDKPPPGRRHLTILRSPGAALLLGVATVLLPVTYWDSLRWAVAASPWDLSIQNYGGLWLLEPALWPDRLLRWARVAWYLAASWPVWATPAAGLIALAALPRRRPVPKPAHPLGRTICWLLAAWLLAYALVHIVTSVQVWDRYLLPLAPLLALLTGCGGAALARALSKRQALAAAAVWLALSLPTALAAANGALPVGSDHGAYTGLRESLAWLESHAPADSVIYHQSLGWHLPFHLYGRIGPGDYEVVWYPSAADLAESLARFPERPKLLLQAAWDPAPGVVENLMERGIAIRPLFRAGPFTISQIE